MHLTHRSLDVGEVRIAYRDTDPGAHGGAPPIILVHGLGGDSSSWRPIVGSLVADGRRVITPDLRGHGRTTPAPRYRARDFVDDLIAVAGAVAPDRPIDLIGHSFGGLVASLAAASPDRLRVRRLVLEDTPLPPRADGPEYLPPLRRRDLLLHAVVTHLRHPRAARRFDRRLIPEVRTVMRARNPQWWAAMAGLSMPVLVMDGGPDGMMDPGRLDELSTVVPDLHRTTIAVGHVIHRSDPAAFTARVRSFLAEPAAG